MWAGVRWPIKDGLFSSQVVPCTMEKLTERCGSTAWYLWPICIMGHRGTFHETNHTRVTIPRLSICDISSSTAMRFRSSQTVASIVLDSLYQAFHGFYFT